MEAALDALQIIGDSWLPMLITYSGFILILGFAVGVRRKARNRNSERGLSLERVPNHGSSSAIASNESPS
jgi:hypothetical protein